MLNPNDIRLEQERYQELVRAIELQAKADRDETGLSPVKPSLKEQLITWKSSLQHGLTFTAQRR